MGGWKDEGGAEEAAPRGLGWGHLKSNTDALIAWEEFHFSSHCWNFVSCILLACSTRDNRAFISDSWLSLRRFRASTSLPVLLSNNALWSLFIKTWEVWTKKWMTGGRATAHSLRMGWVLGNFFLGTEGELIQCRGRWVRFAGWRLKS